MASPVISGAVVENRTATALASAKATSRRGPCTSESSAGTTAGMKPPRRPKIRHAPMLNAMAGAIVSRMAAAAEPSVATMRIRPRPRVRIAVTPNMPTIIIPAAIALVWRLTAR